MYFHPKLPQLTTFRHFIAQYPPFVKSFGTFFLTFLSKYINLGVFFSRLRWNGLCYEAGMVLKHGVWSFLSGGWG
jgi:hypothetical protein